MPEIKEVKLVYNTLKESAILYFDSVQIGFTSYEEDGSSGVYILEHLGKNAANMFECEFTYEEI